MIYEQLPPSSILQKLKNYKTNLENLLKIKKEALEKTPAGYLKIIKNKGTAQYYWIENKKAKAKYISKKEVNFAKSLAQKEYNKKIIRKINLQYEKISEVIDILETNDLDNVYNCLSQQRKNLVEPVTLSDTEYAKRWLAVSYKGKGFAENTPELFTAEGIRVRSKSEVIIADTLSRLGIPFRYEYPVKFGKIQLHPDFYCLNIRKRKEIIWEHLGLMDNSEYADNSIEKQNLYIKNGFIPGKNLIFTMESKKYPFNSRIVEKIAREVFA